MGSIAIAGGGSTRSQLTANTNFYVSNTGSDSNNGLTSGTAWATLQHADDTITGTIDLNGWNAVVNIAAGTYVGVETINGGYFSSVGAPTRTGQVTCNVRYQGDDVTPSNVQITQTSFRKIGFGQFAPNPQAICSVTLSGLDFVETVDTAIWYDNFYVGSPAQGNALVRNSQFDAAGADVPLMSGNVSTSGTITVNGSAAGWVGSHCTGFQADGNESGLSADFFQEAAVTIIGNPRIDDLLLQIQASSCLMTGAGAFTGAYNGEPFIVSEHSRLVSPFVSWSSTKFGTPAFKPEITDGGLFVVQTGLQGLEATGGQIIGVFTNYFQPVTGFTKALGQFDGIVIIDPAGALATGTITMPSPVINNQRISIRSSQTITALTITAGGGETLSNAPTTITAGGLIDVIYRDANTTWYF